MESAFKLDWNCKSFKTSLWHSTYQMVWFGVENILKVVFLPPWCGKNIVLVRIVLEIRNQNSISSKISISSTLLLSLKCMLRGQHFSASSQNKEMLRSQKSLIALVMLGLDNALHTHVCNKFLLNLDIYFRIFVLPVR